MIKPARAFAIFAAAFAIAAVVMACAQPAQETRTEPVPAPDFSIRDLQGNTLSLAAYKGKVLVVNFWATWCPPCRKEIPDFVAAYKELKGEGLEILGLSVDEMTAPALIEWTKKMGVNYPIALATPEIIAAYEPGDFIPATIIIDRKGMIRFRQSELMTKETLVRLFQQYK
ncbi:MAG: TlpA family protein disulfide reductase [Candidatus Aminicenantes bacterium]|nr:MAG: TlpA family protein disulfide reductase [Candidatus Aminicenantes bacterium]